MSIGKKNFYVQVDANIHADNDVVKLLFSNRKDFRAPDRVRKASGQACAVRVRLHPMEAQIVA